MQSQLQIHRENDREAGYVLIGVIFLTVILLVSLAVAAPKIAMSIQRDKELETIHRGAAIPASDQTLLSEIRNVSDVDRSTSGDEPDPVPAEEIYRPDDGQRRLEASVFWASTRAAAGLFRTAADDSGRGNDEQLDVCGCGDDDYRCEWGSGGERGPIGLGCDGRKFLGDGRIGSSGSSFGSSGSSFGSRVEFRVYRIELWLERVQLWVFWIEFWAASGSVVRQPSTSRPGSGLVTSSSFGSSVAGTSATTFGGGGPIVGFTLPVDKPSLIDYMLQTRYNKWEFNYDPAAEQAQAMAGLAGGGTPPNGSGSPGMPGTPGNGPGQTTPGQIPTPPPGSSSPQ